MKRPGLRAIVVLVVTFMLWPLARIQADGSKIKPPGDCTEEQHRQFQDAVDTACKTRSMSCHKGQDCQTLLSNIRQFDECIEARRTIMRRCFRGGDEGHRNAVERALEGLGKCIELAEKKKCFKTVECR